MKEYLSIWRLLPRATIGLALALVVLLACRGTWGLQTLKAAIQLVAGLKSDFVALAVGVLALAVISNIGWQFANIASSALGTAFEEGVRRLSRYQWITDSALIDLVAPVPDIVMRTYQKNRGHFMRHYALKSAGDEKLEQRELIEAHFNRVLEHADAIPDWEVVCSQAYAESLSQDQRKIENMEEDLRSHAGLLTVFFLSSPVVVLRLWSAHHGLAIGIGLALLVLAAAGLPSYVHSKRNFARFQLASYLDVFTVSEMTEYTEREGEPKL